MIGKVFGWIGRKAVLYVSVLAAMLAYVVWSSGDIQAAWEQSQTFNLQQASKLKVLADGAERRRYALESELGYAGERAQRESLAVLEMQIQEAQVELGQLRADRSSNLDTMLAKATLISMR